MHCIYYMLINWNADIDFCNNFFSLLQFGLWIWRVEKIAKMDGQYCLDDLWMKWMTLYSSINFSVSHPFSRSTPASSNTCNVCRCYDKSNNRCYVSMDISWFKMYNIDIRKQRICGWCNLAIANDFFFRLNLNNAEFSRTNNTKPKLISLAHIIALTYAAILYSIRCISKLSLYTLLALCWI